MTRAAYGKKAGAYYPLFGLVSLFDGFAKTEDTVDAAAPVVFAAAVFLGFLNSRFDLM